MSIKTRIWLLLALLCAASIAMLEVLIRTGAEEATQIHREAEVQLTKLVVRTVRYTNNQLYQFSRNYRKWDDLAGFVRDPSPAWPRENIDRLMDGVHIERLWILRADASLVHEAAWPAGQAGQDTLPPADELLPLLRRERYAYFSLRLPSGLYRIQAMPIVPLKASRILSPPEGWLLIAKRWDEAYLQQLGELCEGSAVIAWPGQREAEHGDNAAAMVRARWPLKDPQDRVMAHLVVSQLDKGLHDREAAEKQELLIFVAQGVLGVILVGIFLQRGVLAPFALISESLARKTPAAIRPLLTQRSEFGHVARLVQSAFADRETLQRALDERARLERDIHDSVIQSIYAAGMILASARPLLSGNPTEAERLIDETHTRLNAAIRDLRAYLGGGGPGQEPEPPAFSRAVAAVIGQLQSLPPVRTTLEIDDRLADALSLDQRSQLLQILRESVSNALRHGQATQLKISLGRDEKDAVLEFSDDGNGFDPAVPAAAGRGLANLAERARILDGFLKIDSAPGRGTKIRVGFSFPGHL